MSMSVVRELITIWGFDIDDAPLKELERGIDSVKISVAALGASAIATAAQVGFLLNEAAEDEQVRIAFETMLGSAQAAMEMLENLKDFAIKTPFTLPGIKANTKLLLGMGIESEKMIPTLKFLGDVAAGLSVPLERLALNFGQVKSQGKLTGRELRDFAIAGVPLTQALADSLGKTTNEIAAMVSKGEIGFEQVKNAFIAMTSGSGRFADLMDKQSRSFLGILSNIQDFLLVLSIELGNELLPAAKDVLNEFLDWLTINREIIKQDLIGYIKTLVGHFKDLVSMVKSLFRSANGIVQVFGGWNNVIEKTLMLLTAFTTLGLLHGIGLVTQALGGLIVAWSAMGNAALVAQAKMALIPLAIGAVMVAIGLIVEDIVAFSQGRDSVFGRMVTALDEVFSTISEKFGIFGDIIKIVIAGMLTPIRMLVNSFKSIGTIIDVIRGKTSVMQGLGQIATNYVKTFDLSAASKSVSSAIGIDSPEQVSGAIQAAQSAQMATEQVTASDNPIVGLGTPFGAIGEAEKRSVSVQARNELTINVQGMEPDAAKEMVTEKIFEELGLMMRETVREGESEVER